jgi:hypothetical protein
MTGVPASDITRRVFVVISSNYFATVGVPLAAGRTFRPRRRPGHVFPSRS